MGISCHLGLITSRMGNLKDLKTLNSHLEDKSYIEGYTPSLADTTVFDALGSSPSSDYSHALRWYKQIQSYGDLRHNFRSAESAVDVGDASAIAKKDEEEAAKIREERLKAYS